MNDLNPSLHLGEDGIESILCTLGAIRERVLSELIRTFYRQRQPG